MLGRYIDGVLQSKIPGSARIQATKDMKRKANYTKKGTVFEIYVLDENDQPVKLVFHHVC